MINSSRCSDLHGLDGLRSRVVKLTSLTNREATRTQYKHLWNLRRHKKVRLAPFKQQVPLNDWYKSLLCSEYLKLNLLNLGEILYLGPGRDPGFYGHDWRYADILSFFDQGQKDIKEKLWGRRKKKAPYNHSLSIILTILFFLMVSC